MKKEFKYANHKTYLARTPQKYSQMHVGSSKKVVQFLKIRAT